MKDFHITLRKIRVSKGLSQENIGDELNITGSAYAQMERGESKVTVERLYELSEIFKMDVADMLHFEDAPKSGKFEDPGATYKRGKGYEVSITIKITDPEKESQVLELIRNLK